MKLFTPSLTLTNMTGTKVITRKVTKVELREMLMEGAGMNNNDRGRNKFEGYVRDLMPLAKNSTNLHNCS